MARTLPPPSDTGGARPDVAVDDGATDTASVLEEMSLAPESEALQRFLVVRHGERTVIFDLSAEGQWVVGRGADVDIALDDARVSRRHAIVRASPRMLSMADLGSHNGTTVNMRPLRKQSVRVGVGDVVRIGGCEIIVAARAGRASPARTPGESEDDTDVVLADPEMARVYASVRKVAALPTTVLVLGATGTGKDVVASRIHKWSGRAEGPFLRFNCGAVPETLLESELFGHERGAFTGADRRKAGYFEAASGGTIFLDEIGELSASAQVRLLHVLENRAVVRLGGTSAVEIDARVVSATHRDLQALVAAERFRADLYYRLSAFVVRVPPLRERPVEIPLLAKVFVAQLAQRVDRPAPTIASAAIAALVAYPWPGNVRELRNAVEHAFAMAEGPVLELEHFAADVRGAMSSSSPAPSIATRRRMSVDRAAIEEALAAECGNQTRAAARLGMPRRTLVYKLAQYRRESGPASGGDGGDPSA